MTGPAPFDLLGPLPTGTLVLEASAGTGKTYAIAGLVTRLVAEGHVRIDQILAVTFGRAASRELRTRIRDRLLATRDAMPDQPAAAAADDALVAFLAGCAPSDFTVRRDRLDDALSRFDTAGVATIHEFAAHTLHQLGISADTSPSERHEADTSVLVEQVIADTYAARYAADPAPVLSPGCAVTIGRAVAADPLAGLDLPVVANPEATARQEFAVAVRAALGRRKLLAGVLDFDDLITRVRDAVTGPAADAAVAMLRDRYRVVLVDEFQDTDAAQWDILAAAFHGHATLVLIGDPKQAIYGFRGGDIHAYLAAVARADQVATLATNYRSDAGVVAGITDLFGPTELGDPQIVVRDVRAHHQQPRLRGAGPAVRLREVPIPTVTGALTPEKVGVLRDRVAADVAADIASLLTAGPTVQQPDGRWRPVTPGDIAVLVRDGKGAAAVLPALERHGLPAVHRGGASVFTSRAAGDWLTLLRAVEQPGRPTLVREVGLTPFFGHAAADLAGGGEAVLDDVARVLRRWVGVWRDTGLPAMLSMILRDSQVVPGLLGRDEGERDLTDARHIAEALQQAARDRDLGPGGLLRWLDGQIATAARTGDAEQERRLASDARAITVQTLHVSKGLQFPIVYVPFGWDRYLHDIDVARFHDAAGRRLRDARGRSAGPAWNDSTAGQRAEEGGEELRLLYVGLTRARHQVVLHWAGTSNSKAAPVHRLLCARAAGQTSPAATYPPTHRWQTLIPALTKVSIETVPDTMPASVWTPPAGQPADLEVAPFDRALDTVWRRTSFTGLTSGAHDQQAPAHKADEPDQDLDPSDQQQAIPSGPWGPAATESAREVVSPMTDLPGGTRFGTLVHAVYEMLDTSAPDLAAELLAKVAAAQRITPIHGIDTDALATALLPSLNTPLGPLAGGATLANISPADRLPELAFEMPLSAAADPQADPTLADVADLWRAAVPGGDPLAGYADRLTAGGLDTRRLRGFASGEIDAVLRIHHEGAPRYLVVDYKTNWLGPPRSLGEPLTAWHYRPEALPAAMLDAHYPLQALLYSVALHRYLRHRQPGYDPAVHLGGVLYLFVRGMCGPTTPTDSTGVPCGVFAWQPAPDLITAASDLLGGIR